MKNSSYDLIMKNKKIIIKNMTGNEISAYIEINKNKINQVMPFLLEYYKSITMNNDIKYKFDIRIEHKYLTASNIPAYVLYPAKSENTKLPAVLFIHGIESSKEKSLRYGLRYAVNGIAAVLIDAPKHGERKIKDFEKFIDLKKNPVKGWENRMSIIKEALVEMPQLLEDLCNIKNLDNNRLGMAGISMGATIVLLSLLNTNMIKAAAVFLPVLDYENFSGNKFFKFIIKNKITRIRAMDPLYRYDKEPQAAMLLQSGREDRIIGRKGIQKFNKLMLKLYKDKKNKYKFIENPGIAHDVTKEMNETAVNWFDKFL